MSVGSLVLRCELNDCLWLYSMSCHSCRHTSRWTFEAFLEAPSALQDVDIGSQSLTTHTNDLRGISLAAVAFR